MNLKDVLADHDEEQHINRSARLKNVKKTLNVRVQTTSFFSQILLAILSENPLPDCKRKKRETS